MSLDDYLKLLDWTGRQFRADKRGVIPATCAPNLDRLACSEETWFDLVRKGISANASAKRQDLCFRFEASRTPSSGRKRLS
jgi:hypothetical protein